MKAVVKKKKRYLFLKIVLLIFMIYTVISLIQLYADTYENKQLRAAQLEEQKQREQRIEDLEKLYEGSTGDLVEYFAREKLDYVYPGEEVYQIIGD